MIEAVVKGLGILIGGFVATLLFLLTVSIIISGGGGAPPSQFEGRTK